MSSCDQFRELYEAYALGALDPQERAELQAHLATGCDTCATGVAEARWLVSQLAYSAPDVAPSDMLKGRLLQTVRAEGKSKGAVTASPAATRIPWWAVAGIAALLLLTLYSGWHARQLQDELREANRQNIEDLQNQRKLERELAFARKESAILADASSVSVALAATDKQSPTISAKWNSKLGIVLSAQGLAQPAPGHVLQLWLVPKAVGGAPIPSVTVRPDAEGRFVLMVSNPPGSFADTKALAITEEPAGGSKTPTAPIRWVGAT